MDLTKYRNKGLVGLENLGNTCFLNACMQVLSNTYELNHFLDKNDFESHIKTNIPDSLILNEWNDLRNVMWSGNGVIRPKKFVFNVQDIAKKKNKELFTGHVQNDMPEFLLFFMECIHNSISRTVHMNINGEPKNEMDKLAIKCYNMLKETYSNEYSEIMDLFYGIYYSDISNLKTNESYSVKPESFFILDLPVIDTKNKPLTNIYDSLNVYTIPDILEGDNAWFNEKTNQKENVKKQIQFWSFPQIVIITLRRFTPDGQNKIINKINFPINDLDLSKYVKGYNASTYKYDLFGICNHVGGVTGGHYTAFVRNVSNKWLHYNDQHVEIVNDMNAIISPAAYCLFYRKKNNIV